ncbi:MAG: hypothetical protein A3J85_07450 [Desulfobacula sp. RIFOXYA12_FULL_46_16]|nr:MAG: hypothetical protein A2464_05100 [Deltaproteobacteria bacterium RIFOXYC2_FULL_48_10]OGR20687.1 MAG: hypothetical protein A3J85_07450 [Desulfobacula sp. RIFOXYA12_FULL_46_16]OGR32022.1 MAG: hypothetical protein A3J80_09805 [Desulfobacula sp. RIFOXYB2_FULL_45_6]
MDAIGDFDLSRKPLGAGNGRLRVSKPLQTGSDRLFLLIQRNNGQKPASLLPPKVQQENRIIIDGTQKNFPSGCNP